MKLSQIEEGIVSGIDAFRTGYQKGKERADRGILGWRPKDPFVKKQDDSTSDNTPTTTDLDQVMDIIARLSVEDKKRLQVELTKAINQPQDNTPKI